eukprot:TRINITY_DN12274_c0_g1_i11.p3 TRINITY_DN12274_c0_g1~~TRINITY_DN12274_c0_g1_i11.p3  ORF type:complete len:102 (+),score=11.87 TRINITY_DN12274_c0_g1_i11:117-422(+)
MSQSHPGVPSILFANLLSDDQVAYCSLESTTAMSYPFVPLFIFVVLPYNINAEPIPVILAAVGRSGSTLTEHILQSQGEVRCNSIFGPLTSTCARLARLFV